MESHHARWCILVLFSSSFSLFYIWLFFLCSFQSGRDLFWSCESISIEWECYICSNSDSRDAGIFHSSIRPFQLSFCLSVNFYFFHFIFGLINDGSRLLQHFQGGILSLFLILPRWSTHWPSGMTLPLLSLSPLCCIPPLSHSCSLVNSHWLRLTTCLAYLTLLSSMSSLFSSTLLRAFDFFQLLGFTLTLFDLRWPLLTFVDFRWLSLTSL